MGWTGKCLTFGAKNFPVAANKFSHVTLILAGLATTFRTLASALAITATVTAPLYCPRQSFPATQSELATTPHRQFDIGADHRFPTQFECCVRS